MTWAELTAPNATLTISWHHTHRLPANVLIFLWQTWHLLGLLSVRVQSWAATWDAGERNDGDENVCFPQRSGPSPHGVSVSDLHSFQLTKILFDSNVFFLNKQGQKRHHMIRPHCQFIGHTSSHWHIYYAKEPEKMWAVICWVLRKWVTTVHNCAKLGRLADVPRRVCRL